MGIKETFGNRLKTLRGTMNQQELADVLEISRASVGYYENATRTPDIEFLEKVSSYFGVSCDYLLGKTDVRSPDVTVQEMTDKTGLSEKTVKRLISMRKNVLNFEDGFIVNQRKVWLINNLFDNESIFARIAMTAANYHTRDFFEDGSTKGTLYDVTVRMEYNSIGPDFCFFAEASSDDVLLFLCQQNFSVFLKNLTDYKPEDWEVELHAT